eukprot:TRINITY_DN19029_c0_g1_i2.p1 TRINITY_DN19029_c0_g1~~TRINITY_DN19029_c0_g1_i2.p1  ORF type:complete len:161 (-),score=14.75 TRINITY_DN19029_c0_g1_i2:17-499(-)
MYTQVCFLFCCACVAYRSLLFPDSVSMSIWQMMWLPYQRPWIAWDMVKGIHRVILTDPVMTCVAVLHEATLFYVGNLLADQIIKICSNKTVNESINMDRYGHFWVLDAYGNRLEANPFCKGGPNENLKDFFWDRRRCEVGPECPPKTRNLSIALKKAGAQ